MNSRDAKDIRAIRSFTIPRQAWCNPYIVDGFCYSLAYEDGQKGILVTGGFAGVHEFHPFFSSEKECG